MKKSTIITALAAILMITVTPAFAQKESGLARMLAIRFDIEHLTGKEAIELVRQHQK